jgi:hypothetical protein
MTCFPRLELSYVPLNELRPSARKLRKLAHVLEVAASISLLGFCDPLLVGRGNELIDGEARYEAAKQLGLDRVPCVHVEHLNPDEQRVLRLAANRLADVPSPDWQSARDPNRVKSAALADVNSRLDCSSIGRAHAGVWDYGTLDRSSRRPRRDGQVREGPLPGVR